MTLNQTEFVAGRLAYSFDHVLSVCVFTLKQLDYSEAQIAQELSVDTARVHEILSERRVRDGVVKALVLKQGYGMSMVTSLKQSAAAKRWH
ncbi:TPA: hypothetical protein ACF3I9_004483 [Klebsiella aerogenes]